MPLPYKLLARREGTPTTSGRRNNHWVEPSIASGHRTKRWRLDLSNGCPMTQGGKCRNLGLRALGAWGIICEELDAGMCGFCAPIGSRERASNTSNRIGRIAPTQLMTDSFRWPTSRRRRVFLPRRHGREAVLLCRVPIAMCRGRRKPKREMT